MKLSEAIDRFATYLTIEKNASNHTIRSYMNDLNELALFFNDEEKETKDIDFFALRE